MNKQEFSDFLKDINLSKKEFAELSNISYNTVNNWNDDNRPIPPWVESWLENYNKVKAYDDIKEKILEIENIKIKTS
ncbi:XRE family transcriptional regulator [Arcobacter butzleri]|uniref:XRE family transcriptional regulator n=1 Tax=Aliarcobacter butzleri TaxID=28197 RepID=UPI00158729F5|nr:XRE family transcriptional regulator [Aliarcobacter butzleri]NUW25110.1 XRE family transcriptional regulator [Aliarcobacter butzleri]